MFECFGGQAALVARLEECSFGGFSLKRTTLVIIAAAVLLFVVLFAFLGADLLLNKPPASTTKPSLFVGVDVGYGTESDVHNVAEAVKGYANLIILGSLTVTSDTTTLMRVCDYLYANGFYFIIYIGFGTFDYVPPRGPDQNFFNSTQGRWGDKFLGVYLFDEVGGKQLDGSIEKPVPLDQVNQRYIDARDYSYVSQAYQAIVIGSISVTQEWYVPPYQSLFVADYGLYWFDYLSGYNTVFTEFVGNQSRQIAIALSRGAAHTIGMNAGHTRGQDWGVMITWKYTQAPFLEDGNQLYNDMVLAYQNDATYIIIFNSPENRTAPTSLGTLTADHLDAMKRFWNFSIANPRNGGYPADIAYVLPKDYGFGLRAANDTIWGLWPADNNSTAVWSETNNLLSKYGNRLDVIYETKTDGEAITLPYNQLIFWNGTTIQKQP